MKLYNVGAYLRISRESVRYRDVESGSLENQQAMLNKFVSMMPGWVLQRTYVDDGASGGSFDRQGFKDMMADVRQGIINLVLVKDLSRFGRNYIEAGKYLEEELPALGCRFVALSDGIDTETGENDIMPFLNAMNDYYLKNTSDRIKYVMTAKAKDGQKLSGTAPYGYIRDTERNTRLVVDEYAANIVRRIFETRSEGSGYAAIAGMLNRDGIMPPRMYYFKRQNRETASVCTGLWTERTIKLMLQNELYIGNTLAFKRKTRSYRDKRAIYRDESEWIRTDNTHVPIIDTELWRTVQRINEDGRAKSGSGSKPQLSLFSGIVVCADCSAKMVHVVNTAKYKSGRVAKYGGYVCSAYRRSGRVSCSWHKISELNLKEIVLSHIKEIAGQIALDEDKVLRQLKHKLIGVQKSDRADRSKERRELEQRIYKLETNLEQLYEDKVLGVITSAAFSTAAAKIEAKRAELSDKLSKLAKDAERDESKTSDIKSWISLIKEKSLIQELDRDLLESLIERIVIGEKEETNGEKAQNIHIFYKYVGLCN
jgi:DNA invertase Pin-like site-specific DNA recombinase